ncbi:MAG: GNAT family N-acetyltransferase [Patescibacteria group bacterium]
MIVESALNISPANKDDFLEQVMEVERSAWPPELQASKSKFESRFNIFPQGFFVVRLDGKIKGVTTSQLTQYDPSLAHTWDEITDGGMIKETHGRRIFWQTSADDLYVVSVGVAADAQGRGVGGKLVQAQLELAKKLKSGYLFLGARAPGYDPYCKEHGEISIEEYLKLKNDDGDTLDPEIRFYERQGLRPAKIIPNFEPDPQSRDFGVVMVWENPQK